MLLPEWCWEWTPAHCPQWSRTAQFCCTDSSGGHWGGGITISTPLQPFHHSPHQVNHHHSQLHIVITTLPLYAKCCQMYFKVPFLVDSFLTQWGKAVMSPKLEYIQQCSANTALSSSVQVQPWQPALSWIITSRRITNVVFVNDHYPAESPALLIVRDRGEDIQDGGVGPALVNLENKEISSGDITVVSVTAHTL